jgi:hypothetical protein
MRQRVVPAAEWRQPRYPTINPRLDSSCAVLVTMLFGTWHGGARMVAWMRELRGLTPLTRMEREQVVPKPA